MIYNIIPKKEKPIDQVEVLKYDFKIKMVQEHILSLVSMILQEKERFDLLYLKLSRSVGNVVYMPVIYDDFQDIDICTLERAILEDLDGGLSDVYIELVLKESQKHVGILLETSEDRGEHIYSAYFSNPSVSETILIFFEELYQKFWESIQKEEK